MIRIAYPLILLLIVQCSFKAAVVPEGEVIYNVDKVGVFIYNCSSKETKKIFSTDAVFLEKSSLQRLSDSLIMVGFQGASTEMERPRKVYSKYFYRVDGDSSFVTDNPPYTIIDKYTLMQETFYAVNLYTTNSWKYKTIDYEYNQYDSLRLKIYFFSKEGAKIKQTDTLIRCGGSSSSSKGIVYGNFERFYSESEIVNKKQVFSRRGNLVMKENNKENILLKFDGHFEPKFGSGYYNPTLSKDGKKIAFQYLAGFLQSGSGIFEMDLQSKEKVLLTDKGYYLPKYSPDGSSLLMAKNSRFTEEKNWINDICFFDIKTKKATKIAEGDMFIWK